MIIKAQALANFFVECTIDHQEVRGLEDIQTPLKGKEDKDIEKVEDLPTEKEY